jgi:hypothetical protein
MAFHARPRINIRKDFWHLQVEKVSTPPILPQKSDATSPSRGANAPESCSKARLQLCLEAGAVRRKGQHRVGLGEVGAGLGGADLTTT